MDLMELFFVSLGAAVAIYFGVKVLLSSKMLFPNLWFPVSKTFFTSMGEWAGELRVLVLFVRPMSVIAIVLDGWDM